MIESFISLLRCQPFQDTTGADAGCPGINSIGIIAAYIGTMYWANCGGKARPAYAVILGNSNPPVRFRLHHLSALIDRKGNSATSILSSNALNIEPASC
jgi:hypothetical protein